MEATKVESAQELKAQVNRLRGVLRLIAHHLTQPGPTCAAEETLRFAQELARAALTQEGPVVRVGDFAWDMEQFEEARSDYERGNYQTVEEILHESQGHRS